MGVLFSFVGSAQGIYPEIGKAGEIADLHGLPATCAARPRRPHPSPFKRFALWMENCADFVKSHIGGN